MYSVTGDGSWQNTGVVLDGNKVDYTNLHIVVNKFACYAVVDGSYGPISSIVINGVYLIISAGKFENTRVIVNDEQLRGVQEIEIVINKKEHPRIKIDAVLLPNIVEVDTNE